MKKKYIILYNDKKIKKIYSNFIDNYALFT